LIIFHCFQPTILFVRTKTRLRSTENRYLVLRTQQDMDWCREGLYSTLKGGCSDARHLGNMEDSTSSGIWQCNLSWSPCWCRRSAPLHPRGYSRQVSGCSDKLDGWHEMNSLFHSKDDRGEGQEERTMKNQITCLLASSAQFDHHHDEENETVYLQCSVDSCR